MEKTGTYARINPKHYARIKKVCEVTGQPIAFHIHTALERYMSNEFIVLWESKLPQFKNPKSD